MTEASTAAIEKAIEFCGKGEGWEQRHYEHPTFGTFTALRNYIQKVSDIAERCDALLQELIVKDVDPVEEMFGRDSALTGFSTDTIRSRIEAFGYKLVKDE